MAQTAFSTEEIRAIGLPIVIINTVDGQTPTYEPVYAPDGSFGASITGNQKLPCQVLVVNQKDTLYNSGEYVKGVSGATIKVNGNTSAIFNDNKPYKLKLQKKADLLFRQDEKYCDKEWRLLGDGVTLNTIIGLKISELMGMAWTPAYQPCNVVLNGDYRGCYLLIESVKRNSSCRLNVDKESGYIVERDAYWWNEDNSFCTDFFSTHNYYRWTWKYPDEEDVTEEQERYITDFINCAEKSIDEGTYNQYIDIASFASWLLAQDILGSKDSGGSNIYLLKHDSTNQSLLQMANLWDFDSNFDMEQGQFSRIHTSDYDFYYDALFKSPNKLFAKAYKQKWNEVKEWLPKQITDYINTYKTSELGKALQLSWTYHAKRYNGTLKPLTKKADEAIEWFHGHLPLLDIAIQSIDADADGIHTIPSENHQPPVIHRLNGQRVSRTKMLPRGIYIINNRKFIVR